MTETEEASPRGVAILSDDVDSDGTHIIHGVAIGEDDTTLGKSGKKKRWLPSALKQVAATLEGVPLTTEHSRDPEVVVGEVTDAAYEDDVGVVYEAELDDADLAKKVENGRLEVSPRIYHPQTSDLEQDDDDAYLIDEAREARHLALVQRGAAPSNSVAPGEAAALSAADLQAMLGHEVEADEETEDMSTGIQVLGRDDLRSGGASSERRFSQSMKEEDKTHEFEDLVDEARELDNPVVAEESEIEDLREEVQQVKQDYADLVSEASPFDADELVGKFSVEDLREKHQDLVDDGEVEDLTPDPQSGDPDAGDSDDDDETAIADLSGEDRKKAEEHVNALEEIGEPTNSLMEKERDRRVEALADLTGMDADKVQTEVM